MKNLKNGKLSTGWIAAIAAIVIILMLVLWVVGAYNSIVSSEVNVDKSFANVESVYQRRADLIPNLVETVKGAKDFEQETIVGVTEARSAWTNAKSSEEKLSAANGMDSALSRLMVVVEAYPDLKSNQNFLALQDELTNTENKIAVERQRYNDAVSEYNKKIKTIPTNMIAGLFGFDSKAFFDAQEGAENAPGVSFD